MSPDLGHFFIYGAKKRHLNRKKSLVIFDCE